MKAYRQGDVIVKVGVETPKGAKKLSHLVLAEGEVTGHKHQIKEGEAELYEHKGTLFLKVISDEAVLGHEEHKPITLPRGDYEIGVQREFRPEGWTRVRD